MFEWSGPDSFGAEYANWDFPTFSLGVTITQPDMEPNLFKDLGEYVRGEEDTEGEWVGVATISFNFPVYPSMGVVPLCHVTSKSKTKCKEKLLRKTKNLLLSCYIALQSGWSDKRCKFEKEALTKKEEEGVTETSDIS